MDEDEQQERAEVWEEELTDFVLDWAEGEGVELTPEQKRSLRQAVTRWNRPAGTP